MISLLPDHTVGQRNIFTLIKQLYLLAAHMTCTWMLSRSPGHFHSWLLSWTWDPGQVLLNSSAFVKVYKTILPAQVGSFGFLTASLLSPLRR